MAILKCKMCGGDIELSQDKTFGTCEFCGSTMTFPKVDDEQRAAAFNRGNHFRRIGEFDKALAVYERIVQEDENDAEAHWCCALCRFGIEYVEDPNTFEYLPTCHRASFDSFLEDVDYLAALEHSDGITRRQYQKDAAKIADVQRGILATSQNEEPFDVFICYKESENDGTRTRDSLMAQEIYYQLTEQGRRVFFSRITLEDKAGTEYEPYIFAALNSAKVMIVVTTSAEHVNAVWVKNEWSRFLSLMRKDRSKLLLPCYRDMDPYDLPEALSVLQSYDMGKIGFIQDLIRGINKVLDADKPKETVKETVVIQQQAQSNTAPLLKRAFMFLEDGDFTRADEFCEQVLNLDPENAEAYLGKLMAELKIKKNDNLKDCPLPFSDKSNYQKAFRFGDEQLKTRLSNDIAFIKERNELSRKKDIFKRATDYQKNRQFANAIELYRQIPGFENADECIAECEMEAENDRKDAIYDAAVALAMIGKIDKQQEAIEQFQRISHWKDADEQVIICDRRIQMLKEDAARARIEAERKAEEARIAAEQKKKKMKIVFLIGTATVAVLAVVLIIVINVIIPNNRYNDAKALYAAGQYEEALAAFRNLNGYKDSGEIIKVCEDMLLAPKYDAALTLFNEGKYEETIEALKALDGYKDSESLIEACEEKIRDFKYSAAADLYNEGKYEEAITAFEALNGYKDSTARIEACNAAISERDYEAAVVLYKAGRYEDAIIAFEALKGYKDSTAQLAACVTAINDGKYEAALALYDAGKYEDAIEVFESLNGYKESAKMIKFCKDSINNAAKEEKYLNAQKLYNDKKYSEAVAIYTELGNYKDSAKIVSASQIWSVIGSMKGSDWAKDIPMYPISDDVYATESVSFENGDEFKIRKDRSWDINYGTNGQGGFNYVVKATGRYNVYFNVKTGAITIEAYSG